MNLTTILLGALLLALFGLAAVYLARHGSCAGCAQKGKAPQSGCSGCCAHCAGRCTGEPQPHHK